MINEPSCITTTNFQEGWLEAVNRLMSSNWELWNLTVHIQNCNELNSQLHTQITNFYREQELLTPKQVAWTIFPNNLYRVTEDRNQLFSAFNRPSGVYDRAMNERRNRKHNDWGTYFRRMTHYGQDGEPVNQLERIIYAICNWNTHEKAAHTITIQNPGTDTARVLGGPCLNYMAVQLHRRNPEVLGLFSVYRNHDFLARAYGNYLGLCNLLKFMANETRFEPGPLTCFSSHAYVNSRKTALKRFLAGL